jgi:hypothetical protein
MGEGGLVSHTAHAGTQIMQVGILKPLAGGQFSFFKISLTTAIISCLLGVELTGRELSSSLMCS